MGGREVLGDHIAETAALRQLGEQFLERLQSAGGCADADENHRRLLSRNRRGTLTISDFVGFGLGFYRPCIEFFSRARCGLGRR